MCGKRSCGKMAGIPSSIPMKDMRTGSSRSVQTTVPVGGKPTLKDQRGMNQRNLNVRNPLNGKR